MLAAAAALLLVAAAAAAAPPAGGTREDASLGWRLSSHTCPPPVVAGVTDQSPRTCTFRNLYLLGGHAYYLAEGTPPAFSKLGLDFEFWREGRRPRVGPDFLSVVTPARFTDLVASVHSGGGGGGSKDEAAAGNSSIDRIPTAYFWRARKVRSDVAHGATCDGNSTVPGRSNFYHFIAEHMPILSMTLCDQFGHCDQYQDRSVVRIIDVTPGAVYPCHIHENYPPFYEEALACLSDRPLRHINGSTLRSRLTLVETAWMGLGPRCRGIVSGCYPKKDEGSVGGPRLPPTPGLMASWRRTLGQCFGFPADAAAPLRPVRLLVVDRLYESGRHILNVETVMRALRSRFSLRQVHLRLEYLEGLTVRQQAQLFSGASLVVHMHGAASGNYPFLPRGAQVVLLAPTQHRWTPAFAQKLARDLGGVTDIGVKHWANPDPRKVHLLTEVLDSVVAAQPDAAELLENKTFMSTFLATFDCPKELEHRLRFACTEGLQRALNVAIPPEVVVGMSEEAVAAAFNLQGQQWEPLPVGAGAAQHAPLPLRPTRAPFIALGLSSAALLAWLAVCRPALRGQLAGGGRPGRPP